MLFCHVPKITEENFKSLLSRGGKDLNVCYLLLMCHHFTLIEMIKTVIFKYLITEKLSQYMRKHRALKIAPVTHKVSPSKSAYLNCLHIIQTSVDKNISVLIYYLVLCLLRSVVQKLVQGAEF